MSTFVGHDKLIHVLRVYGILATIWPLDPKTGKFKALFYKILWCVYVTNGFIEMIALLMSTSLRQNDVVYITKILVEITCYFEVTFNVLYCKMQEKRLQVNTSSNLIINLHLFIIYIARIRACKYCRHLSLKSRREIWNSIFEFCLQLESSFFSNEILCFSRIFSAIWVVFIF